MTAWSPDQARKTYSIPHWAAGYFDVDGGGRVVVRPRGAGGPAIALPEVVNDALAQGASLPLLVRFPDVLGDRLHMLPAAFAQAQADWDSSGRSTAVYTTNVHQPRGVTGPLATNTAGRSGTNPKSVMMGK